MNRSNVTVVMDSPENTTRRTRSLHEYEEYLSDHALRVTTITFALRVLRGIDEAVGLEDLSPRRLREHLADRQLAASSVYTYTGIVARWSAWRHSDGIDPFRLARRPPAPNFAARPLLERDLEKLLAELPRLEREWTILAAYAGLRIGEVQRVDTRDLEPGLLGRVLRIPEGKGGVPGIVPAHELVCEVLDAYPPGRPYATTGTKRMGRRIRREYDRLGVVGSLHNARHSYATRLYRQTRDVLVVQRALRHSRLDTTSKYIRPDDASLFDAVCSLALPVSG